MTALAKECLLKALENLNTLRECQLEIVLKEEQKIAIEQLLLGNDVLAVLPTGYGKSMIFTLYYLARQEILSRISSKTDSECIIVTSPLTSIIADQITEMESLGFKAVELSELTLKDIVDSRPQFIYCSAENAIIPAFIRALQNELHESVAAIVVDESHTVETWTGKRKKKGKYTQAFRSAFGKISILRSMCKKDCPLLALTGTADTSTRETICKELLLKNPCILFVSPNRPNLRFSVSKVKKINMLAQLDWLVDMIKDCGINTPKTIIFCDTMYAIANVANYMMMQLECNAFHPRSSTCREHCLIGIMHSAIQKEYKQRLLKSLKGEGTKRVAIATTSLSTGVNFPDIRYVVMFGLPRSLLDLHQEAGRRGRDELSTDVLISYYGKQVSHCDDDVRHFVNATGCCRVAAYSSFDVNIAPLLPSHQCCSFCSKICCCNSEGCNEPPKPFERVAVALEQKQHQQRPVSEDDRKVLEESLQELLNGMFSGTLSPLGATAVHGFSQECIVDVVANCQNIFTQEDIFNIAPTFSKNHASQILGILSEIFDDIDEVSLCSDETACHVEGNGHEVAELYELLGTINDSASMEHDIDELYILDD